MENPLKPFTDIQLFNELARRKRLRKLTVTRMFYKNLESAEGYLAGIDADLARLVGKKILDEKIAIITNSDRTMPETGDPMIARDAEIVLIVPEPEQEKTSE